MISRHAFWKNHSRIPRVIVVPLLLAGTSCSSSTTPSTISAVASRSPDVTSNLTPLPSPTDTSVPPSITPAPILTPEPAPVLLPGWESVNIETLCLTIEEEHQRYEDLEVTVAEQNIASMLTHTFSSLGITIADHTGDCPASLVVTFSAVPVSGWYDYTETLETYHCYSGVEAVGSLVLEYPGLDPYSIPLDNTFSLEQQLETCPEAPQPETHFPAIWHHKVTLGLVDIWGIQAHFPFLEQEDLRVSVLNTTVSLSAISGEEDFLREKLGNQNEDVRFAAQTFFHSLDPRNTAAGHNRFDDRPALR